MLAYEILLMAAANAIIDTIIVLVILSKRTERMMGVTKVEQNGVTLYAPLGPDGEPIQVPIGIKEVDGVQTPVMGYAPLGYTLPYLAADMATMKIKMAVLGAKSATSKALGKQMMAGVADGSIDPELGMQFAPKKLKELIGSVQALKAIVGNLQGGNTAVKILGGNDGGGGGWKV